MCVHKCESGAYNVKLSFWKPTKEKTHFSWVSNHKLVYICKAPLIFVFADNQIEVISNVFEILRSTFGKLSPTKQFWTSEINPRQIPNPDPKRLPDTKYKLEKKRITNLNSKASEYYRIRSPPNFNFWVQKAKPDRCLGSVSLCNSTKSLIIFLKICPKKDSLSQFFILVLDLCAAKILLSNNKNSERFFLNKLIGNIKLLLCWCSVSTLFQSRVDSAEIKFGRIGRIFLAANTTYFCLERVWEVTVSRLSPFKNYILK